MGMLSALEKYLVAAAGTAKAAQGMGKLELLGKVASKAGGGAMKGAKAVAKNPLAAGIGGGAGLMAGYEMGSPDDEEMDEGLETSDEEELLRKLGYAR